MAVSESYLEYVLDQLESAGPIYPRRMFGGVGLYCEDLFFALIAGDVLYFKTDASTRNRFESASSAPFCPYGDGSYAMSYYEVPAAVLEDRDELKKWALEAIEVAARAITAKGRKRAGRKGAHNQ